MKEPLDKWVAKYLENNSPTDRAFAQRTHTRTAQLAQHRYVVSVCMYVRYYRENIQYFKINK